MDAISKMTYDERTGGDLQELFDGVFGGVYIEVHAVSSEDFDGMVMHTHDAGDEIYHSHAYANRPGCTGYGWARSPDATDVQIFESLDRDGTRLYRTEEERERWMEKHHAIAEQEDKGTKHMYYVIDNIAEAFEHARAIMQYQGVITAEGGANGP